MTDTALQEPWSTAERQRVAVQFGMWAFLATETLFFGGLFLIYAVARFRHPTGFAAGAGSEGLRPSCCSARSTRRSCSPPA